MAQEDDEEMGRLAGVKWLLKPIDIYNVDAPPTLQTETHYCFTADIGRAMVPIRAHSQVVLPPDLTFNVDEVQQIVRDNVELCLGGNAYSHSRTPQWITIITEKTLARLNKLNKPYKYIMRITITQKNGSGLHTAAAYYWDIATDGTCTVRWENKYMYCIVNIWALALQI